MTFDELLVEDRIAAVRRLQARRLVPDAAPTRDGRGVRRALAAALVRLGARLDGEAVERLVVARRVH